MKLELTLDKTKMPKEILRVSGADDSISYERPPESLSALVNLKKQPLINIAEVAKNGGKDLSPTVKTFMDNGYQFFLAELGINLGPSTEYNFKEAELVYELLSEEESRLTISDIFPQTTYEDELKVSGSIGLDLGLSYKIPTVPLDAALKAKFAIEPKQWIWEVPTIESTGQGTCRASWLFNVDKSVANLQTSIVIMIKPNYAINVAIGGWVEINPGFLQQNYYYNIKPAQIKLEE